MVAKARKIRNGLFKPRLYGNIGKLLNENSFGGLGITPQMDLLSVTFHSCRINVATESHFSFFRLLIFEAESPLFLRLECAKNGFGIR